MANMTYDELRDRINYFNQTSLYINNDAYQNIDSDFRNFNSIGECKLNSFINDLLVKLIRFSKTKQELINVYKADIDKLKKHNVHTGRVHRFRPDKQLRELLKSMEVSNSTVYINKNSKRTVSVAEVYSEKSSSSGYGEKEYSRTGYASYLKKYLDHLLNEYGSLSTENREKVFFSEKYKMIAECIREKKIVRIRMKGIDHDIRPYEIIGDPSVRYLYLIGYIDENIVSFRFSRLVITNTSFERSSGELSYDEEEQIKKRIESSGIAYLSEEAVPDISVLMTDIGYSLYSDIIIHQRPPLAKSTADKAAIEMLSESETEKYKEMTGQVFTRRIHCCCTARQAQLYFTRFGGEAVVTSPDDLAKECLSFAVKAAKAYTSINK